VSHPLSYMISSATEHPDLALAVIAKATTDEANTRHALNSTHLGILTTQSSYEPYTSDVFLTSVTYMVDFAGFLPNNPNYGTVKDTTYVALTAVQAGEFTAQEAVDFVVETLLNELGDEIIILGD